MVSSHGGQFFSHGMLTSLASRSQEWTLLTSFWLRIRLYSDSCEQSLTFDNKARWRSHVIGQSSLEPQLKFPGCSHFRRRSENTRRQRQLRETMTWMTQLKSMHQKMDFLPSSRERTSRLGTRTRQRERKQPPRPRLRLRRQSLLTGLPGPVTRSRRQFHPVFLWWEDLLGPTALPGPRDLNTIGRTVVNGVA